MHRRLMLLTAITALAAAAASAIPLAGSPLVAPVAAGSACGVEVEPNERPEQAASSSGDLCVEATLTDGDQDLFLWRITPADALFDWVISMRGVVGTITSVRVYPIVSAEGVLPLDPGPERLRVDSDAVTGAAGEVASVSLEPGLYLLGVSRGSPASGPPPALTEYRLDIRLGQARPVNGDSEPNDDALTAGQVAGGFELIGDLDGSQDALRWELGAADASSSWDLVARGLPGSVLMLTLLDADGTQLASAQAGQDGIARLYDLRLGAGSRTLLLGPAAGTVLPYVLGSRPGDDATVDPEPNDTRALAVTLDLGVGVASGRLAGSDVDFYRFTVDTAGAAVQTSIELMWGSGLHRQLCLYSAAGLASCRVGPTGVLFANLLLPVGDYVLEISGSDDLADRYELRISDIGLPVADREIEPNDVPEAAAPFDPEVVMHGQGWGSDGDYYRVTVSDEAQLWLLEVEADRILALQWVRRDGGVLGEADLPPDATRALLRDLYLSPGDHWFHLRTGPGDYSVRMTPLGPPAPGAEREPNSQVTSAELVAIGQARVGRLFDRTDVDVYRFSLAGEERVSLRVEPGQGGAISMELRSGDSVLATVPPTAEGGPRIHDARLPAGEYQVVLAPVAVSEDFYTLRVERGDPFTDPGVEPGDLPVTLAVDLDDTQVAAYWPDGQSIVGQAAITNAGASELTIRLDALVSADTWQVALDATELILAPGASVAVPLALTVGVDAPVDVPVRITVRALGGSGAQRTAFADVVPRQDVAALRPVAVWLLPDALLGGLDVASLALGAEPIVSASPVDEPLLYDEHSVSGSGLGSGSGTSLLKPPLELTVDLAGDAAVPVAGFILDPLAAENILASRPRAFEVLLSDDGATFDTVLAADLSPQLVEQPFVLDAPVAARFARLRILSTHGGTDRPVALGEWKVIAVPGTTPWPDPLNIAEPRRGGHVVLTTPVWTDAVTQEGLLTEDATAWRMSLPSPAEMSFVVGFRDDRAASVTELRWMDPAGSDPTMQEDAVTVEVSTDSPLGPWELVGTWTLQRAADGSVAPLPLHPPLWARFVRLTGDGPPGDARIREMPAMIQVIERATDAQYRSVLGEWGRSSRAAIREWLDPPRVSRAIDVDADDDTPDRAISLEVGQVAAGTVLRHDDADWYWLTVPEGDDLLTLAMGGDPFVAASVTLFDESGTEVPLVAGSAGGQERTFSADVVGGATYRIRVEQPPVSIAFTYDTSGSIARYLPYVGSALRSFAAGIVPGREEVLIIPFQEAPLLEAWSADVDALQNAVVNAIFPGGSSAAETSLLHAMTELAARQGTHAILVLTDAESTAGGQGGDLWSAFGEDRPVVFAVHLGGGAQPASTTHLMQDWAISSGGHYQYAVTQADIDRAFERMAAWLRRPAGYRLSYTTAILDPPPSTLRLTTPSGSDGQPRTLVAGGDVAVELVLDTSGSMLQKLGSSRRIDVAKAVLRRLVTETLPEGLPVALRTFKVGGDSCGTELAVPLGPLDPASMAERIAGLEVVGATNTPIGAALRAVAGDLADVEGPRIVILVTDGKETCGLDPGKEVKRLVAQGLDVQVNIVGFALDDKKLKRDIKRWARLGHGAAFDAKGEADLAASLAKALRAPFRVYDDAGVAVASGVVGGGAVELEPGTYRVEVLATPTQIFESVEIRPGRSVDLSVEPPP